MFLDIAIGIFGALFFDAFFDISSFNTLLFTGIAFALLPDVDFLIEWIKKRNLSKVGYEHRDYLHFPLIYTSVGALVIGFIDIRFVLFFIVLSLGHFLHDSIGIGWGIKWFHPISNRAYKFFCEKDGRFSSRFIVSWTPEEQRNAAERYGDKDWIKNIYLKPHPISIIDYSAFAVAIIALFLRLNT